MSIGVFSKRIIYLKGGILIKIKFTNGSVITGLNCTEPIRGNGYFILLDDEDTESKGGVDIKREIVIGSTLERAENKLSEIYDEIRNSKHDVPLEKLKMVSKREIITNKRRIEAASNVSSLRGKLFQVVYIDREIQQKDELDHIEYLIFRSELYVDEVRIEYF